MIMTLKALEREIVIVHNAKEEEYKEFGKSVLLAAFQACKKNEKAVIVADFTYSPIVPMHIKLFSAGISNEAALRKILEELYLSNTVFSKADYIEAKTGKHPREILARLVHESLGE